MAAVIDRFGEGFMQRIGTASGGDDMLTLFRNVSVVGDSVGADQGSEFLNNLAATSEGVTTGASLEGFVRTPEEDIRPVGFPDASRVELSIIDRIIVVNGNWEVTVMRGDTLSLYSSAVYGDALSYLLIFKANQDKLRNPDIINVGQRIRLPRP